MIIKHPNKPESYLISLSMGSADVEDSSLQKCNKWNQQKKMSSGVNTKHSVVVITYLTYYNPDIYIHIWLNYYYFLLTFTVKTL